MLHVCTFAHCNKSFDRPWKLRVHYEKHRNNRTYACPKKNCQKAYFYCTHLRRHIRKVHKNKKITCPANRLLLIRLKELRTCNYRCAKCKVRFSDANSYLKHIAICEVYTCNINRCSRLFRCCDHYEKHVLTDHTKVHLCDICKFISVDKLELRQHIKRHLFCKCSDRKECSATTILTAICRTRVDYCYCAYCNYVCDSKIKIYKHLCKHQVYKCNTDNCTAFFYRHADYRRHCQLSHTKYYQCDRCALSFSGLQARQLLISHVNVCYDLPAKFKCSECQRRFRYKRNLRAHILAYHSGNSYVCPILNCQKILAFNHSLKHHMQLHKEKKIKPPSMKKTKVPYAKKLALKLRK